MAFHQLFWGKSSSTATPSMLGWGSTWAWISGQRNFPDLWSDRACHGSKGHSCRGWLNHGWLMHGCYTQFSWKQLSWIEDLYGSSNYSIEISCDSFVLAKSLGIHCEFECWRSQLTTKNFLVEVELLGQGNIKMRCAVPTFQSVSSLIHAGAQCWAWQPCRACRAEAYPSKPTGDPTGRWDSGGGWEGLGDLGGWAHFSTRIGKKSQFFGDLMRYDSLIGGASEAVSSFWALVLEYGPNGPNSPNGWHFQEVKSSDDIAALVDDKGIGETVEARWLDHEMPEKSWWVSLGHNDSTRKDLQILVDLPSQNCDLPSSKWTYNNIYRVMENQWFSVRKMIWKWWVCNLLQWFIYWRVTMKKLNSTC